MTTAVRTGGPGAPGLSILVIPTTSQGLSHRRIPNSGQKAGGASFVELDNVYVPVSNLVGKENQGFPIIMKNFNKERFIMFWTIAKFEELTAALEEAVDFYKGYDPVITWWIEKPWKTLKIKLNALVSDLKMKIGVDGPASADDIVGDPIGREALLEELAAEWIAYTPEELIEIGEKELEWCEKEMKKASKALGFDSSADALEHVKNNFVKPGEQIHVSANPHSPTFLITANIARSSVTSPTKQSPTSRNTTL